MKSQWQQFLQLFEEKNQHLSQRQMVQEAKKSFQKLKKHYQKGGVMITVHLQNMAGDLFDIRVDSNITVEQLKVLALLMFKPNEILGQIFLLDDFDVNRDPPQTGLNQNDRTLASYGVHNDTVLHYIPYFGAQNEQ
ncbi:MAG: hypothetical protein WCJ72_07865 [Chryseobacterium sp.]